MKELMSVSIVVYLYMFIVSSIDMDTTTLGVMIVFLCLAAVGLLVILWLWYTQYKYLGNLLEMSRKEREQRMAEINDKEVMMSKQGLDAMGERTTRWYNYAFLGIFAFFFIAAWVLFFVFSATGNVA